MGGLELGNGECCRWQSERRHRSAHREMPPSAPLRACWIMGKEKKTVSGDRSENEKWSALGVN